MVHLEYAEAIFQRATIGICVETRAQHYQLTHTVRYGRGQSIFSKPRSDGDKYAQCPPGWVILCSVDGGLGICAENTQSQRIGEYEPSLKNLMSGPMPGGPHGCPTGSSILHGEIVSAHRQLVYRDERFRRTFRAAAERPQLGSATIGSERERSDGSRSQFNCGFNRSTLHRPS